MRRFNSSKKGFDVNQMFIFVTAVVVVGFVILFGAKTIGGFLDTSADIENLQMKKDLEQLITLVKNDHGSQKLFNSKLPSEYTHICFIDLESSKEEDPMACPEELENASIRLCPIWANNFADGSQQKNLILVRADKSIADPLNVPGIRLEDDTIGALGIDEQILCVSARSIELRLRGDRQEAFISQVVRPTTE